MRVLHAGKNLDLVILTFITLNVDKETHNTYIFNNYNLVCGVG